MTIPSMLPLRKDWFEETLHNTQTSSPKEPSEKTISNTRTIAQLCIANLRQNFYPFPFLRSIQMGELALELAVDPQYKNGSKHSVSAILKQLKARGFSQELPDNYSSMTPTLSHFLLDTKKKLEVLSHEKTKTGLNAFLLFSFLKKTNYSNNRENPDTSLTLQLAEDPSYQRGSLYNLKKIQKTLKERGIEKSTDAISKIIRQKKKHT